MAENKNSEKIMSPKLRNFNRSESPDSIHSYESDEKNLRIVDINERN